MVRGTMVRGSVTVSEDEVRGTAGGADAVDVAGSEEPRESSDRAIVSVSEDEVRGTAVRIRGCRRCGGIQRTTRIAEAEHSINLGRPNCCEEEGCEDLSLSLSSSFFSFFVVVISFSLRSSSSSSSIFIANHISSRIITQQRCRHTE